MEGLLAYASDGSEEGRSESRSESDCGSPLSLHCPAPAPAASIAGVLPEESSHLADAPTGRVSRCGAVCCVEAFCF
jgi:hypothetical protein